MAKLNATKNEMIVSMSLSIIPTITIIHKSGTKTGIKAEQLNGAGGARLVVAMTPVGSRDSAPLYFKDAPQ